MTDNLEKFLNENKDNLFAGKHSRYKVGVDRIGCFKIDEYTGIECICCEASFDSVEFLSEISKVLWDDAPACPCCGWTNFFSVSDVKGTFFPIGEDYEQCADCWAIVLHTVSYWEYQLSEAIKLPLPEREGFFIQAVEEWYQKRDNTLEKDNSDESEIDDDIPEEILAREIEIDER